MRPSMPDGRTCCCLDPAERFLLWTIRAWVRCRMARALPAVPVDKAFADIGLPEAASALDAALQGVASATIRRLTVHGPDCPALSDDEGLLLAAVSAARHRNCELARRLLGTLVPPAAADRIFADLSSLGLVLASAGIALSERADASAPDLWTASPCGDATTTLH